jgi:hypothetical protein
MGVAPQKIIMQKKQNPPLVNPEEIDPASPLSVLQVLPLAGVAPDDAWAEVQAMTLASGETAVAVSVRLVLDDGLLVRHVSGLRPDETVAEALARVVAAMQLSGLRSIDALTGEVDVDEPFHTHETVRTLTGDEPTRSAPTLH